MNQPVEVIEYQKNEFYRDRYRSSLGWVLILGIICVGLASILGVLSYHQQQSRYYASMTNGNIVPLYSLTQPTVTNDFLLQWVSIATRSVMNLDFVHYQDQLNQAQIYFTPGGWKKFQDALQKSGLLPTVLSKKLMMTAVVSGAPIIVNQAVLNGHFTWTVQMPVLVTFSSASENSQTKLVVTVNVQRVSTLDTTQGIQISDFLAETQI